MGIAQDIFEVKLSWKGVKKLEEAQQKFHDFLEAQGWNFKTVISYYEKENERIELQPRQQSSGPIIQFQIGNEYYPVKKFEGIKELLEQMIQCKDIEDLKIHDINLKGIKEEFRDFIHKQPLPCEEGEWHTLK